MNNFLLKTYLRINSILDKNSEEKQIQLKILKLLNGEDILNVKLSENTISIMVLLNKKDYSIDELNVINLELIERLEPLNKELENYEYNFKFIDSEFKDIEF